MTMFRCQRCHSQRPAGEQSHRVATEWRAKVYPHRAKANQRERWEESRADPGGTGREVVKEQVVCEACLCADLP